MATDTLDEVVEEFEEELPRRKVRGKRLILFAILPLLLLGGGAAAAYFMGMLDPLLGGEETAHEDGELDGHAGEHDEDPEARHVDIYSTGIFYDLPDILVNLTSDDGRRQNVLKLSVSLELPDQSARVEAESYLPRIIDNFQIYLRELRVSDLRGSAGLYRLREELMRRVDATMDGVDVRDILFREMLVQ